MNFADCAKTYLGIKEYTQEHKDIIDYYNTNIKPLPRKYKVKYSDAWCATFVSIIWHKCNADNAPYECSVAKMVEKAKKNNQYHNKATVHVNDVVIYDWNNDGTYNHVGIVYKCGTDFIYVIEGNYSNSVKMRYISKSDVNIYGYIHVEIKSDAKKEVTPNIQYIASQVISGKYGNGIERKTRLEQMGYNYQEVQAEVNRQLQYASGILKHPLKGDA